MEDEERDREILAHAGVEGEHSQKLVIMGSVERPWFYYYRREQYEEYAELMGTIRDLGFLDEEVSLKMKNNWKTRCVMINESPV